MDYTADSKMIGWRNYSTGKGLPVMMKCIFIIFVVGSICSNTTGYPIQHNHSTSTPPMDEYQIAPPPVDEYQIAPPPVDEYQSTTQKSKNGVNIARGSYPVTTRPPIKTTVKQLHETPEILTNTTAPPQTLSDTPSNKPSNQMSALSDTKIPTDNNLDTKIAMTVAIGSVFVLVFIVIVILITI